MLAGMEYTSADFGVHWPVQTRWTDNDMFGHLNNAVYYQLFDTAINAWINTSTGLDPLTTPALGIVAAVLGVVKTMGSIDKPPEILGGMIGSALVGTFLGVLLAYGIVGPLAGRLKQIIDWAGADFDGVIAFDEAHAMAKDRPPRGSDMSPEYRRFVPSPRPPNRT